MSEKVSKQATGFLQVSIIICLGLLLQACDTLPGNPVSTSTPKNPATPTQTFAAMTSTPVPPSPAPTTFAPTIAAIDKSGPNWQYRWLEKSPCAPPCWEGIIPGVTTGKEALDILKNKKDISQAEIFWSMGRFDSNQVTWEWMGGFHAGGNYPDGGGRALFNGSDAKPIFLIAPHLESSIILADIIKVYGEPSHILAGFNRNIDGSVTYFYYLVYLALGFDLLTSENFKFDITANTSIKSIAFFASGFEGYKKASTSENEYKYIVPWQGFKSFDFYCQKREKNDREDCSKI